MITATDARWPALALLSVVLAWGALLHAAGGAGRRMWVLYALAVALGVYCNALVVLMLPAHLVALVLLSRRRRIVPWAVAVAAAGASALPLALALRASDAPNPLVRVSVPSLTEIPGFLATLVATGTPERIRQIATLVCVVVVVAGLATLRRGRRGAEDGPAARAAVVLLAWVALPVAAAFVISQLGDSIWQGRYVVGVLPAIALLLTWSAARIGGRPGAALWTVLALGSAALTAYVHVAAQGEPTDRWARALAAQTPPGAAVVFSEAEGVQVAGFYEPRFRTADGDVIVPAWDRTPVPEGIVLLDNPTFDRLPPGPPSAALVGRLARRHGTVTMALRPPSVEAAGVAWARRNCRVGTTRFDGTVLVTVQGCRIRGGGTSR
jgi:4-amino-4-deoxy-L-arabinose transferase-like glycosyltransferase